MEVLLLTDISGIGRRNDLLTVSDGFALNNLLPSRRAIVATPNVRRRYAEQIKQRALEREQERQRKSTFVANLQGKTITVAARASKAGKLYAGISAKIIANALMVQHGIGLREEDVRIDTPIKTTGQHSVSIASGADAGVTLIVEVKAAETSTSKA